MDNVGCKKLGWHMPKLFYITMNNVVVVMVVTPLVLAIPHHSREVGGPQVQHVKMAQMKLHRLCYLVSHA